MTDRTRPARDPDPGVDPMFPARWSPRAFAAATLGEADITALIGAARWAPSAANVQPWRFAWGLRGDGAHAAILGTLNAGNRDWAARAGALIAVGALTVRQSSDGSEVANPTHAFDAGAAWMALALQAQRMGLAAHAMGGFDKAALTAALAVPAKIAIFAVVAVGHPGDPALLSPDQAAREAPGPRKPLAAIAGHGRFPE